MRQIRGVPGQVDRPEYATRHFQALSRKSGLPGVRLHDLRHTNASLALEAGVEMKVVSDRLGHSQISVTADLYTHVSRSLGNAAAEQIAGVLRAPSDTVPTASLPQAPKIDPSKDGEADAHP
ncbi:MAG TPA: site-specific integrase [Dermatophilaceae bacterium]|nr:site-specific integrase [Dermatophilaceae bacterium]